MENIFENRDTSDILFHEFLKCSRLIFATAHGGRRAVNVGGPGFGFGHHHGHRHHGMNEKGFLRMGQGRLLSILLNKNGTTQKELAELLTIAPASVSELINKLESGGYIEKKQNEEDKRITNIFLTDGGRFYAEKMEEDRTEIAKDIFSSLDENEQKQLISMLQKLASALSNGYDGGECMFQHQHNFRHGGYGRGRCIDNEETL